MALAMFRRNGRHFASLLSPHPVVTYNPSFVPQELTHLGVRYISFQKIRDRMRSIGNIAKVTKAMKMVAASKLRKVQSRTIGSRSIWIPFTALLGDIPSIDAKKNVIIAISSDKGLCGGINSTTVKAVKAMNIITSGTDKDTKLVISGEKARAQLGSGSSKDILMSISGLQKITLNYTQISVMADDILKNLEEYDALRVVFNKFKSALVSEPTLTTVLSPEILEKESQTNGKLAVLESYEIEGSESKIGTFQNLAEFQFSCVLFNAVLENACSEQGSRMAAMDGSSKNAAKLLSHLTLTYNRTRQASITSELCEIISATSAMAENENAA